MEKENNKKREKLLKSLPFVSIVTPTNRKNNIDKVFENYHKQKYINKELIVILNDNSMSLEEWRLKAKRFKDIRVFQIDEEATLGECRNFGAEQARYDYIAHFDDDDYYAPNYLVDSMKNFLKVDADIIGKTTTFMYFEESKYLAINCPNFENKYVTHVPDGTLIYKRYVFEEVKFSEMTLAVEKDFLERCIDYGFKIYSINKYNYTIFRAADKNQHTWQDSDKNILRYSKIVTITDNYKAIVSR